MGTIGQIIGFVVACFLFRLTWKLYNKKDSNAAAGFVLIIATVTLFCSFTWFQGWAKAVIQSNIISELRKLGEQVTTVQDSTSLMLNDFSNQMVSLKQSTTQMHSQLADHQAQIDKQQRELQDVQNRIKESETNIIGQQVEITNQYRQIATVQLALSDSTTNISKQEEKLSSVEYWVHNIYDNAADESYSIHDTNNILFAGTEDGSSECAVRLTKAPVIGSIDIHVKNADGTEIRVPSPRDTLRNVISLGLHGFDTNSIVVNVRYVSDNRATNIFKRMPILNKEIWFKPNGGARMVSELP